MQRASWDRLIRRDGGVYLSATALRSLVGAAEAIVHTRIVRFVTRGVYGFAVGRLSVAVLPQLLSTEHRDSIRVRRVVRRWVRERTAALDRRPSFRGVPTRPSRVRACMTGRIAVGWCRGDARRVRPFGVRDSSLRTGVPRSGAGDRAASDGPRLVAFEGPGETVPGRYVAGLAIAVGSVRSRPS